MYDGVVCDPTVQVRRVAFWNSEPSHFFGMDMYISQYENSQFRFMTDEQKEEYLDDDAREHTS